MTTSSLTTDQSDHDGGPRQPQSNIQTPNDRCNPGRPGPIGEATLVRLQPADTLKNPKARRHAVEMHNPAPAMRASAEQLISFRGTAKRLDLSIRAVYRLVARGHLPHPVKVGGARKFFESDLARYLDALKAHRN